MNTLHQSLTIDQQINLTAGQDGTSDFSPLTWDDAGNEAGFFVRDAF